MAEMTGITRMTGIICMSRMNRMNNNEMAEMTGITRMTGMLWMTGMTHD